MDLIGKYLGIWVNRDEIVEIFGLHPASTAKVFIVGGEVIGAIPALGSSCGSTPSPCPASRRTSFPTSPRIGAPPERGPAPASLCYTARP